MKKFVLLSLLLCTTITLPITGQNQSCQNICYNQYNQSSNIATLQFNNRSRELALAGIMNASSLWMAYGTSNLYSFFSTPNNFSDYLAAAYLATENTSFLSPAIELWRIEGEYYDQLEGYRLTLTYCLSSCQNN